MHWLKQSYLLLFITTIHEQVVLLFGRAGWLLNLQFRLGFEQKPFSLIDSALGTGEIRTVNVPWLLQQNNISLLHSPTLWFHSKWITVWKIMASKYFLVIEQPQFSALQREEGLRLCVTHSCPHLLAFYLQVINQLACKQMAGSSGAAHTRLKAVFFSCHLPSQDLWKFPLCDAILCQCFSFDYHKCRDVGREQGI